MQTAPRSEFVAVEDYLAAEQVSDVRHEYLGGLVYAISGETRAHSTITPNLALQSLKLSLPLSAVYEGVG